MSPDVDVLWVKMQFFLVIGINVAEKFILQDFSIIASAYLRDADHLIIANQAAATTTGPST